MGPELRGDVTFLQVAIDIVLDALFVVLFIAFFPRGQRATAPHVAGVP